MRLLREPENNELWAVCEELELFLKFLIFWLPSVISPPPPSCLFCFPCFYLCLPHRMSSWPSMEQKINYFPSFFFSSKNTNLLRFISDEHSPFSFRSCVRKKNKTMLQRKSYICMVKCAQIWSYTDLASNLFWLY